MKYLLDTNILSEAVKKTPDRSVLAKLRLHEYEMAVAATVWHEMGRTKKIPP